MYFKLSKEKKTEYSISLLLTRADMKSPLTPYRTFTRCRTRHSDRLVTSVVLSLRGLRPARQFKYCDETHKLLQKRLLDVSYYDVTEKFLGSRNLPILGKGIFVACNTDFILSTHVSDLNKHTTSVLQARFLYRKAKEPLRSELTCFVPK